MQVDATLGQVRCLGTLENNNIQKRVAIWTLTMIGNKWNTLCSISKFKQLLTNTKNLAQVNRF